MMGVGAPETCWAKLKRQIINLWNFCIWLVNLFQKVSCFLLTAPSAISNYACPPRRKPLVPTRSLRFALKPTRHFQQVHRRLSHILYTVYYAVLFLSFEPEIRVNNALGAASSVRREFVQLLSWVRNSHHFVEPASSLPCSQKPATCSDRLQINPVQTLPPYFLKIHFNIIPIYA
jgi:hypothetical protein